MRRTTLIATAPVGFLGAPAGMIGAWSGIVGAWAETVGTRAGMMGAWAGILWTLAASGPLVPAALAAQEPVWPTDGWATSTPAERGLAPEPLTALHNDIRAGQFGLIDRLVVVKDGHLVVSERHPQDYVEASRGQASALGCGTDACDGPDDVHPYNYLHPDVHPFPEGRDVHTLQSVTKSVTATLIGIAQQRGDVEGLDAPLLSFFGDYDTSGVDARLHDATLEDLLTMRSGIEWHESDRPFDDTNTTLQLEASDDWIQFTLDQPMDAAPGEKWVYNSGGSHLMSGVIRSATGQFVDAYAEAHLFGPLGIQAYHWKKTPRGYPDTEGGLYLEAEDLAKIAYLYLRDGVWEGRRILPEGWARLATAKHVEDVNLAGFGYGYQWWRVDAAETEIWAGLGFGGQYLLVLPEYDLIGIVNSWNLFGQPQRAILPAFIRALVGAAG